MGKFTIFCLILLVPLSTFGQDDQNPADFIMKAVGQRAAENEKLIQTNLVYKKRTVIDDINSREQKIRTKKNEVELVTKGKGLVIEKFGRPVKAESGSTPSINFSKAMVDFYDFNMDSTPVIMIDGRAYHVIVFAPTKGVAHPKGDMEEILARMAGKIYIDVENLFIYRIDARLVKEYSRGWFIYRLSQASIELKQREFQNIMVVDSLIITDRYSLFGIGTFERWTITHTDYVYKP